MLVWPQNNHFLMFGTYLVTKWDIRDYPFHDECPCVKEWFQLPLDVLLPGPENHSASFYLPCQFFSHQLELQFFSSRWKHTAFIPIQLAVFCSPGDNVPPRQDYIEWMNLITPRLESESFRLLLAGTSSNSFQVWGKPDMLWSYFPSPNC